MGLKEPCRVLGRFLKHHWLGLLNFAVALPMVVVFLGIADPPKKPLEAPSLQTRAWERALKLTNTTHEEAAKWYPPEVQLIPRAHYVLIGTDMIDRNCGVTEYWMEGPNLKDLHPAILIRVYTRPTEAVQAEWTLTHEYVHYIYFMRLLKSPLEWLIQHPDSEEYTSKLVPSTCPGW